VFGVSQTLAFVRWLSQNQATTLKPNWSLSINLSRELNILLIQAGISKPGNLLFQTDSRGKSVLE